jgi:hypothetical protein
MDHRSGELHDFRLLLVRAMTQKKTMTTRTETTNLMVVSKMYHILALALPTMSDFRKTVRCDYEA